MCNPMDLRRWLRLKSDLNLDSTPLGSKKNRPDQFFYLGSITGSTRAVLDNGKLEHGR